MTDRYNTPPLPKTIPELVSFMWDALAVRAKSFEQEWVRLYLKEKGVCFEHRKAVIKAMVAGIKEHEVAECPCCTDHVKCPTCRGNGWSGGVLGNWKEGCCKVCSGSGKVPKGTERVCWAGESVFVACDKRGKNNSCSLAVDKPCYPVKEEPPKFCPSCKGSGWDKKGEGRCPVCNGSMKAKEPEKSEEKRLHCHTGEERKDCAWRLLPQDYCTVSCSGCKYRSPLPKVKPVVDETIYCHSTEACGMRRVNRVCGPGKTVGCPGQKTGVPYPMDKQLEREKNLDNAEEYRAMLELKTRQLKDMFGFIKRPEHDSIKGFLGQFAEDLLKFQEKVDGPRKV